MAQLLRWQWTGYPRYHQSLPAVRFIRRSVSRIASDALTRSGEQPVNGLLLGTVGQHAALNTHLWTAPNIRAGAWV